jgi:activating signal cointegrator complex subunit 1
MNLDPARLKDALQLLQDTDLLALLAWAGNRPKTSAPLSITTDATTSSSSLRTLHRPISPPTVKTDTPLTISLVGLSAFPDTRKATVLHAKPHDPSDRLYYFCLALRQNFIDAGFMALEERPMVLHATLVNTVYSKNPRERGGETGRGLGRITMDARELVRRLNGRVASEDKKVVKSEVEPFVWAENMEISAVRICKMGAKTVEDEELGMEYEVVGEKMLFPI